MMKPRIIAVYILLLTAVLLQGQACGPAFKPVTAEMASLSAGPDRELEVLTAPRIQQQPESASINLGQPFTLSVSATGTGVLTYRWIRDGQQLTAASGPRLSVGAAEASHEGSYIVIVSNTVGSVSSSAASIRVNLPPMIVSAPQSQTATVGTNLSLSATATGANPLSYQWKKNGLDISGATGSVLMLSNAQTSDSGSYVITVSNAVGTVTSSPVTITVSEPVNNVVSPSITTQPESKTVNQGASVSFSVTAMGTNPLSYQWRRNGMSISGATNASLTLSNVQKASEGSYTVAVTNAAGSVVSQPASLVVRVPVAITQHPISQTVDEGTSVSFNVSASGTAPLSYQWKKDDIALPGQTGASLSLPSAQASDDGAYSVIVSNTLNSVTSQVANLKVNVQAATFSEVYPILQAKCLGCHSAGGQASFANFNFVTESEFFSSQWFQPGNAQSPAIVRSRFSGSQNATMPAGGLPWTQAEFNKLKSWIMAAVPPSNPPTVTFNPVFTCQPGAPLIPTSVRRIGKSQYVSSLSDFFSRVSEANRSTLLSDVQVKLDIIPEDASATYSHWDNRVGQEHVDMVTDVAITLAGNAVANATVLNSMIRDSTCGASATKSTLGTAACLRSFIEYYGRKAFRRPLTTSEITDFTNFFNGLTGDDRIVALLARFLAHPRFFYELDIGENGGSRVSGTDGMDATYALGKYELLSKLAFLFWDAPPDDNLYALVANLDLTRDADFSQVVDSILTNAKARRGLSNFYSEWFHLNRLAPFDNPSPAFQTLAAGENINSPGVDHRSDMVNEVLDLANFYTFNGTGRYEDLMNSPYSFAKTPALSKLYGVPPWDGTTANMVRFPAGHKRSGLISRGAFIASTAEYTRPILKGKKLRVQLLCDEIPPPPANLDIKPLVQDTMTLTYDVVERTTSNATCMACHAQMNPLGFVTENFDSLGRYRPMELKFGPTGTIANQISVKTRTPANLYPGDTRVVSDAVEMAAHIADSGKGQHCMVRQFFRYAYSRSESFEQDGCFLENMRQGLTGGSGTILRMLKESVRQSAFRQRKIK